MGITSAPPSPRVAPSTEGPARGDQHVWWWFLKGGFPSHEPPRSRGRAVQQAGELYRDRRTRPRPRPAAIAALQSVLWHNARAEWPSVTAGGGSSRSDPLLLPLFLHTAGKRSRPKGTSEVLSRRAGARGLSLRSLTGVGAAPARPTRGHCFFAEDCGLGAPLASLPQVGQEKGQRPALQRGVSPRGQQSRDPMLGGQREMTQTDRQTGVLERAWVVEPSRWPTSARREGAWLNLHSGVPLPMSWSLRHMAR